MSPSTIRSSWVRLLTISVDFRLRMNKTGWKSVPTVGIIIGIDPHIRIIGAFSGLILLAALLSLRLPPVLPFLEGSNSLAIFSDIQPWSVSLLHRPSAFLLPRRHSRSVWKIATLGTRPKPIPFVQSAGDKRRSPTFLLFSSLMRTRPILKGNLTHPRGVDVPSNCGRDSYCFGTCICPVPRPKRKAGDGPILRVFSP